MSIFVREYNDVDHIVPLAYALGRNHAVVNLCSINPLINIATDIRFKILSNQPTVHVSDALYFNPQTIGGWIISRGISLLRNHNLLQTNGKGILSRIGRRIIQTHNNLYSSKWADTLIQKLSPEIIILEWGNYEKSKLGELVMAAHRLGVATIAVPHGLNVMSNKYQSWKAAENKTVLQYGYQLRHIDWVVCQHRTWAEYLRIGGVDSKKILVMGSARFCPEWHQILRKAYQKHPFYLNLASHTKLKIVYMDHSRFWRVKGDVVEKSLKKISELNFVDLVIKPTTRNNVFSNPTISQLSENVSDVPSPVLVEWADVVICAASSILVEALLQKKPLIYPKHHHENTGIIEKYSACWQVSDDDALVNALKNLSSNASELPYDEDTVEMFLNHLICGDQSNRDILKDHVELIQGVAERSAPALEKIVDCFGVPSMNQEGLNA